MFYRKAFFVCWYLIMEFSASGFVVFGDNMN
jgi:hypothetical protein